MKFRQAALLVSIAASFFVIGAQAQQPSPTAGVGAKSPYVAGDKRPQGWAMREYLHNTLGWPANKPLWNTAKQKLLDGKQIRAFSIGQPDPELYCQMAPHYDFAWIEMQHSVLSWADVARLIAACPQAGATPMIRLADEFESTLQHATDVGALGVIEPTVDTVEKAQAVARYARFPPHGRRSQGGGQSGSLWGINGVNYRQEVNANMLVTVMIETPTGVANALEIARVPGIDVVLAANSDLANFSGFQNTDAEYQALITRVHDATLAAGKFFGCTNAPEGPTARADEADFRMIQNPPKSHDGYVAPARGGRAGAPATRGGGAPPK